MYEAQTELAITQQTGEGPLADALRRGNNSGPLERVFEYVFTVPIDAAATSVALGTTQGGDDLITAAAPPALGAKPLGYDTADLGVAMDGAAGFQAYFATSLPLWFRSIDGGGNHDTELLTGLGLRAQVTIAEIVRVTSTSVEVFVAGFQV